MLGGTSSVNAFDGRAFPTKPLYGGNPWFLPMIGAWYRHIDRRDRAAGERESG